MTILAVVVGIVVVLVGLGWLGTRVNLRSFAVPPLESRNLGTIPLPTDLPAPVARYAAAVFGEAIPIVESSLVIGTAQATFNGITLPARFKFYHESGRNYYHYIQAGWFGLPLATVNERYLDGIGILDIPGQYVENNAEVNAAANQGLWSEHIWSPSVWFTDPRIRWEAVDDNTARLIIPNAADEEVFTVRFDPDTHLITEMSTLRYRNPGDTARTPWTPRIHEWQAFNGVMVPSVSSLQWGNDAPWVTWRVEAVLYNVDVSARLAQFGGDYTD